MTEDKRQPMPLPTIDRSKWGAGPWDGEGDWIVFEHAGLPCRIVRHRLGHLNGYVGVPKGHPAYRVGYEDVDVEAHGGLTWSARLVAGEAADTPFWWLGFDCAHSGDLQPGMREYLPDRGFFADHHYWTVLEVRAECARLADQLVEQAAERLAQQGA